MGGSDQWGNMVNGVDLGRRVERAELFALTAPLITTSEGKKMGKSASGAVWLNADKLPVYDYWQVPDCEVTSAPRRIQCTGLYHTVSLRSTSRYHIAEFCFIGSMTFFCGKNQTKTLETQLRQYRFQFVP